MTMQAATMQAAVANEAEYRGHVDAFGLHAGLGGLVCIGWATPATLDGLQASTVVLGFEGYDLAGRALIGRYPRPDLGNGGDGFVLFMPTLARPSGEFFSIATIEHAGRLALTPGERAEMEEAALASLLTSLLPQLDPPLTLRPPKDEEETTPEDEPAPATGYQGVSTIAELRRPVRLEVDEAIPCPPGGVALIGWMLAAPGAVRAVRLCSPAGCVPLDTASFVPVQRQGVIDAVGRALGFEDPRCGFIAYAPDGYDPHAECWMELETDQGEVGYRPLPARRQSGMAAIRLLLNDCDPQFADAPPAFGATLGPAVARLHAALHATPTRFASVAFGTLPDRPAGSLVLALSGPLDCLELQMALFARDAALDGTELLLVLDDPRGRRAAEELAESLHARFRLGFALLAPDRPAGCAAACNAGLARARGRHVAFLDADTFATSPGWLARLVARLEADATLGLVAPVLLQEDGTVQHEGMAFRRRPRLGNWWLPAPLRRGRLPAEGAALREVAAVAGAAMVLPTALAQRLGGFDEDYPEGDFTDADLCLRVRAEGLRVALDGAERLLTLGRRSAGPFAERWRTNLLACNAWRLQRHWADPAEDDADGSLAA